MSRGCIHCGWNGHPHLCGCMGTLGKALREGTPEQARAEFERIVKAANADERARRDAA